MKIKYFIGGILCSLIVIGILYLFNINNLRNQIINVRDVSGYGKIVTEYSDKIEKIKKEDCRKSMMNLLDKVNSTHFSDDVSIETYYKKYYSDKQFLEVYDEVVNNCSIKEEVKNNIYVIALSSTNFPNSVKEKYLLSYEFNIKDRFSRKVALKDNDEIGTYTTKVLELRVIKELLEGLE